jgi:hypothetical protein
LIFLCCFFKRFKVATISSAMNVDFDLLQLTAQQHIPRSSFRRVLLALIFLLVARQTPFSHVMIHSNWLLIEAWTTTSNRRGRCLRQKNACNFFTSANLRSESSTFMGCFVKGSSRPVLRSRPCLVCHHKSKALRLAHARTDSLHCPHMQGNHLPFPGPSGANIGAVRRA